MGRLFNKMCLFATTRNQSCNHDECRDFYKIVKESKKESKSNSDMLGKRSERSSCQMSENEKSFENQGHSKKALKVSYSEDPNAQQQKMNTQQNQFANPNHVGFQNIAHNGQGPKSNNFIGQHPAFQSGLPMFPFGMNFNQPSHQIQRNQDIRGNKQEMNMNTMTFFKQIPMNFLLMELRVQSQMIVGLKERLDSLYKMMSYFIKDYQSAKSKLNTNKESEKHFSDIIGKDQNDILTPTDLLFFLKGSDQNFQYFLELTTELEQPLVKERNFTLNVKLVDKNGNTIKKMNKIMLDVDVYSSDIPPILIKTNTTGKNIVKGNKDRTLMEGLCDITKIQIKEVTSHYRRGWVFLVILPSEKNFNPIMKQHDFIDHKQICPLIIPNIIVKAKMPKKKKLKKKKPPQ